MKNWIKNIFKSDTDKGGKPENKQASDSSGKANSKSYELPPLNKLEYKNKSAGEIALLINRAILSIGSDDDMNNTQSIIQEIESKLPLLPVVIDGTLLRAKFKNQLESIKQHMRVNV